VQAHEMSFIIDIWCSYILRGIMIASLSGRVVLRSKGLKDTMCVGWFGNSVAATRLETSPASRV